MTTVLEMQCRDPIVSRDGRPFGATSGKRMRAIGWPLPSVVAGSLRTALGKSAGKAFSTATAQQLLQAAVAGAFPIKDGTLYLPAPHDCVAREHGALRSFPQPNVTGGCDWPAGGLLPVMVLQNMGDSAFKPTEAPAWWPVDRYVDWLIGRDIAFDPTFLQAPTVEHRTHVQINSETGAADEGVLFTTAALPLTHLRRYGTRNHGTVADLWQEIGLSARVRADGWCGESASRLNVLHPLGGERRLVHWRASKLEPWDCPKAVSSALAAKKRIRMVLATPAIFREGWKPGWLNQELCGSPERCDVKLKLVALSIDRWRAVSGWSLAELPNQPRGPKPVKRMVPAGGVYFFECLAGDATQLARLWLEPVSDDEQDRRDGFGLAAWGVW